MDPTQQMPQSMDPTQGVMSPQQQALIMALMGQQSQGQIGNPMIQGMGQQSGGMPPAGMAAPASSMGGGMPTQLGGQMGAPANPYASMLGVQPPQGY